MTTLVRLLSVLVLFSLPFGAIAASKAPPEDMTRYKSELAKLKDDLDAGKRYKHADDETLEQLRSLDEELLAMVEPHASFDELDDAEREQLIAAQDALKRLLDEVDQDRPICRPERKTGSNVRQVVCRSKREESMLRESSQKYLSKPRGCVGAQCGRN